jgi:hypothetical protein
MSKYSVTEKMNTFVYRFMIIFLLTFVSVGILGSGQVFADGGSFNIPQVNDHFDKVQKGPAPTSPSQEEKENESKNWFTKAVNWAEEKVSSGKEWLKKTAYSTMDKHWEKAKKGNWFAGIAAIIVLAWILQYSFSFGVLKAAWETIKGLVYMIFHPIKTIKGIFNAVLHPVETVKGAWKLVSESFKRDVIHGDASSRAEWFGYVVASLFGAKGVDKAGKLSKVSMLSKASKADKASKMGQMGRIGRGIQFVQKTVQKLHIPQAVSKVRGALSSLRKAILSHKVAATVITVAGLATGIIAHNPEAYIQAFKRIAVTAEKNGVPLASKLKPAVKEISDCFTFQQQPHGYFANIPFSNCPQKPANSIVTVKTQEKGKFFLAKNGKKIIGRFYVTKNGAKIKDGLIVKVNDIPKYRPATGKVDLDYVAKVRKDLGLLTPTEEAELMKKRILRNESTVAVLESDGVQIWGRSSWSEDVPNGYSELRKEWFYNRPSRPKKYEDRLKLAKQGVRFKGTNNSTYTHAEGDVFWHLYQYRKQNKILGGKATLHVDRPLCGYCDERQGVKQLVEEVGLDELTVISPSGIQIIRPDPNFKRKSW